MKYAGIFLLVGAGLAFQVVLAQSARDGVEMIFAGDLMISGHVEPELQRDRSALFSRWNVGREADIFVVNLEHPITTAGEKVEKEFNFKLDPQYVDVLKDAGISLVTAANNHIYDYGREGILETIAVLDSAGIRHVGIGQTLKDAREPIIFEIRGRKIGFLSYYGKETYAATDSTPGYAPRFPSLIRQDVTALRPKVDYLVISFHWGVEKAEDPEPWQVWLGHQVIRYGADLVVGHHPHVLQGIEQYRNGTIVYSLGNFVFGGNSRHTYDTAVLRVRLSDQGSSVEVIPVRVKRWQVMEPDEEAAAAVRAMVAARSARLSVYNGEKTGE